MAAPARCPPLFSYKYKGGPREKKEKKKRRDPREGEEKRRENTEEEEEEEGAAEERTKKHKGEKEGKRRATPATPLSAPLPVATSSSAIDDSHHRPALNPLSSLLFIFLHAERALCTFCKP